MENIEVKKSVWKQARWAAVKALCSLIVIITGACAINFWAQKAAAWAFTTYAEASQAIEERFTKEVVVHEIVEPENVPTERLIEDISKEFGINPLITKAMALQESGGWERTDRLRFEPQLLTSKRVDPPKGLTEIEREMWASSHGILQIIYGFHHKRCGLSSWVQLHDPATNIRCGLTVLKDELALGRSFGTPAQRLREALRRYNGTGADAEQYANDVMARLAGLMLQNLGEGV